MLEDKEGEKSWALHLADFLYISSSDLNGKKPFLFFLPINVALQNLSTSWFPRGAVWFPLIDMVYTTE